MNKKAFILILLSFIFLNFQSFSQVNFTELTGASNPFNGITISANTQFVSGDFNADGAVDFYSWDGVSTNFTFYKNNGSGSFSATSGSGNPFNGLTRKAPAYNSATTLYVQDWDNDGDVDVFNTNYESAGDNRYFQNNNGVFTELTGASNPFNGITISANTQFVSGDFNADGAVDFYSWDGVSTNFTFYKNNGSGSFSATSGSGNPFNGLTRKAPAYNSATSLYVQDWDNDGDIDVFNTNYESAGDNRYFQLTGSPPSISSTSPSDGATEVSVTANIVLNFSENVTVLSGNISIRKSSDDSLVESINVTSGQLTGSGTTSITINPSSNFDVGTSYYVLIDKGSFKDVDNTTFKGIEGKTTFNFTTGTPPVFENSTPSASSITGNTLMLTTDIDEAGTIYYIVVADGASTPSSVEVKAGTGSGGIGQITSGNAVVTTGSFSNNFSVLGLTGGTAYDIYSVAQDVALNLQTNPTKIDVTTNGAWTGASNTNWALVTNWSNNVLPTATDNVVIPNVGTKPVILFGTNAFANNITINASSSLTINTGGTLTMDGNLTQNGTFSIDSDATTNGSLIVKGTSTGNVTYKRYLKTSGVAAEGWHLVGAPVNGQPINAFSGSLLTSGTNNKSIALYNNTVVSASRWNYYTTANIGAAGNFTKARGYSVKKANAGTLDFTGTLNVNNTGESIAITDGGDNPAGNRWNLISNPYTAAINGSTLASVNNFLKVNIDASNLDPNRAGLVLWDGSAYVEKSKDDAAFYIAPGQAFFVHAKDKIGMAPNESVNFTEAMQTHQTGNIFLKSSSNYPEIILQISEGNNNSSTKIRYIENRTTGLDVGSDVGTFTGVNSTFKVFTHLISNNEGVDFAIQALPNTNLENMIIPLGVNAEVGKEITFSLNTSNFASDLKIFLEDRLTNTFTRLDEINSFYEITLLKALNGIGRFYIHTATKSLGNNNDSILNNASIYKYNASTLRIVGLPQETISFKLFNVLGKQVLTSSFTSNGVKDISLPKLATGIYVVKLQTKKGEMNKRIIIE